MKRTYLHRAIISGGLWLAMIAVFTFSNGGSYTAILLLMPALALGIILGKAIMETVVQMTGLTFFFSGFGLITFYMLIIIFSLIIAPLYSGWNILRFFVSSEDEISKSGANDDV